MIKLFIQELLELMRFTYYIISFLESRTLTQYQIKNEIKEKKKKKEREKRKKESK